MLNLNARSINANYARLQAELVVNPFSIMCFTESWFKDKHRSWDFGFPGFILHRVDRAWIDPELEFDEFGEPKTGGGVCVYMKSANEKNKSTNIIHHSKSERIKLIRPLQEGNSDTHAV